MAATVWPLPDKGQRSWTTLKCLFLRSSRSSVCHFAHSTTQGANVSQKATFQSVFPMCRILVLYGYCADRRISIAHMLIWQRASLFCVLSRHPVTYGDVTIFCLRGREEGMPQALLPCVPEFDMDVCCIWSHRRMGTLWLRGGAEGLICPKFYTDKNRSTKFY